jgi:hypothetical protein
VLHEGAFGSVLQMPCGRRFRPEAANLFGRMPSVVRGTMGGNRRPRRVSVVLAQWCPHCVPLSVRYSRRLGRRLGVPVRLLDIDRKSQVRISDRLVRAHGDASPDYLIPQVFLEWDDGSVDHLLTGFSEEVSRTERAWKDLLASAWIRTVPRSRGR